MNRFTPNPHFIPQMEEVLVRGFRDVGDQIVNEAAQNISSYSQSVASAVHRDEPRRTPRPSVKVRMGKGLGPIFEFSKMQNRLTKGNGAQRKYPAGINRGVMPRREFFHRAVNTVVAKGLDLRRYL